MGIDNIMADAVTVDLDEKRKLDFSLQAFGMLAKRYGSVQKALDKFYVAEDITQLTESYIELILDMAEAGFSYDETLTRSKIEKIINAKNIFSLIIQIRKAISITIPEAKGESEGDNPQ